MFAKGDLDTHRLDLLLFFEARHVLIRGVFPLGCKSNSSLAHFAGGYHARYNTDGALDH